MDFLSPRAIKQRAAIASTFSEDESGALHFDGYFAFSGVCLVYSKICTIFRLS